MLIHALRAQQSRLKISTGVMSDEQADAAGARGGQFLVRAEPAEDQQHRREQSHRQREDPDERDQQADGLETPYPAARGR